MPTCPLVVSRQARRATIVSLAVAAIATAGVAVAQQPMNLDEVRRTDKRAESLDDAYVEALDDLAADYERAGAIDKARQTLRRRLQVEGDERIADHLESLDELDFVRNRRELSIDPGVGWVPAGVKVTKGREIRIEASGTYRLMYNQELGPDGVRTDSIASDFVAGAPLGTLIATIVPEASRERRGRNGKKDEPKPFPVGSSLAMTPELDGRLFLKVNIPPDTRAVGSLDVVVSGRFEPAR